MKIYTKTGDSGQTSLYGGERVDKDDVRVETYGTVDELNSALGVVISFVDEKEIKIAEEYVEDVIRGIQSDLFFIGAMLAGDVNGMDARNDHLNTRVNEFEEMIDWMAAKMPEQKHFILPSGSMPSVFLHLARTICRRAERKVVSLENGEWEKENRGGAILIYLNRLSDFLFTLAKWVNRELGKSETPWKSV